MSQTLTGYTGSIGMRARGMTGRARSQSGVSVIIDRLQMALSKQANKERMRKANQSYCRFCNNAMLYPDGALCCGVRGSLLQPDVMGSKVVKPTDSCTLRVPGKHGVFRSPVQRK